MADLNGLHLQDLADYLDWHSLRALQATSMRIRELIRSGQFLHLVASRRGLDTQSCVHRCLQSLCLAEGLQRLTSEVFFSRATTALETDLEPLAELCRQHRLKIYVSGHCGRNAPRAIQVSFSDSTREK